MFMIEELHVPLTTANRMMKKYKVCGTVASHPGQGHRKKCNPRLNRW